MRNLIIAFFSAGLLLTSCKTEKKETSTESTEVKKEVTAEVKNEEPKLFGEKLSDAAALTTEDVLKNYKDLKIGDTVTVKFASKINEVCSKKGCWMKLPLSQEEEIMVRFKDYGFFMPLDSQGKDVIVEGKAFVKVTPVDELRHYAEDAGKSKEEIEKITEPKKEMAFLAHGVLLK
ncbi:DUF4920 domain-containing protein [uncultured Tenacibaculum sp.]|uniref:DUF4920 domain-containing protein n=1 Tax=uncultured Tenacibaculum sp. TaxID=174713 RepID=UPI0026093F9A|nr:DUF4920 domain-containing protein [uncultured Tenacibaculum sp.]